MPAAATEPGGPEGSRAPASEIIVTARRREEPLGDVPISITALDDRSLEALGAGTAEDIARAVPNFTIAPTGVLGTGQPAIRGIFSAAGSATVGLYLDDTPVQIRSLGFSGNPDLRIYDLERVEVLRGPQGTLFGANSMGGTVRFIARQPNLERYDARAGLEIASTRGGAVSSEVQGAIGGPIVEGRLGFRAAGYYRRDAGYVDRIDRDTGATVDADVNDLSAIGLRIALRAALGQAGEVTPSLSYQRLRRGDLPFFESSRGSQRQGLVHAQPGEDVFVLPSLTVRVDLGDATLSSVTSHLDRKDRQVTDYSTIFGEVALGGVVPGLVPAGGTRSLTEVSQRSFTQELRLNSTDPGARLRWVVGAFLGHSRLRLTQEVVEPGIEELARTHLGLSVREAFGVPLLPGGISYRGFEYVRERQVAGFGELAWHITDRLEAVAGLRVSRSKIDLEVASEGLYAGAELAAPELGAQRETPVTPRLAITYRPARDRLFYASVSRGFRIGGANPPVPSAPCAEDLRAFGRADAPVSFNSDRLWSYEAGSKSSFARFDLSLALFQIDWSGIQQLVNLPNCGFSYVDNLGKARSRGFEVEAEVRPIKVLRLTAALGFVDARFQSSILGGTPAGGGDTAIIVGKGDRVPYVPRWSLRLAAEYRRSLGRSLRGFARTEFQYASAYRRAPSELAAGYDPRTYQGEAYGNALIRVGVEGDRWQASAFVENLLDDDSILFSSSDLVPVTGAPLRQTTPRPRTIGISGSVRL